MALNGGLAKFTVREDVAVSRTEEAGKTTVTIKVCRTALLGEPRAFPDRGLCVAAPPSRVCWDLTFKQAVPCDA
jgi:hypothetical protein